MPDLVVAYVLSFAFIAMLAYFARRNQTRGWRPGRRPTLEDLLGGAELRRLAARPQRASGQPIGAQLQRLAEALEESTTAPQPAIGAMRKAPASADEVRY